MTDINHKIERYVRKERRRTLIALIAVSLFTIPALSLYMLPNMGGASEITGVVVRLVGLPTDEGQNLYLIVKLKNGKVVRSYIPNSSYYRKGQTVKLQKQEPLLFGRSTYRFGGYKE